jgi:hypothetical protein
MGKKINREGDFVGYAMQSGMGKTKANSYPQFVAQLQAVQELDPDSQEFIDITDVEEVEITGYFVLFGKDNAILPSAKQVKEAYPTITPMSTRKLNDTDLSEIPIKFRVEEREYKGKKKFEVTEITNVDGTLYGGGVTKADDATVDALDAKYAAAFRELNGGDKPAAVPAAKKVAEKKKAAGKPVVPRTKTQVSEAGEPVNVEADEDTGPSDSVVEEPTNKELMKDMAAASVEDQKSRAAEAEYNAMSPAEKKAFNKKKKAEALKAKAAAKAGITKPKIPTVTKPVAPLEEPVASAMQETIDDLDLPASCTQEEAWEACETNAHASKAETLAETWTEVIQEFFGDTDAVEANKIWSEVRTKVLERVIDES